MQGSRNVDGGNASVSLFFTTIDLQFDFCRSTSSSSDADFDRRYRLESALAIASLVAGLGRLERAGVFLLADRQTCHRDLLLNATW